jgi:hypothetical protein
MKDAAMLPLATATLSTADKLRQIPMEFWLRFGAAVLVVIATVLVLRKIAKVNKVVLTVIVGLLTSIVGFNWIYERNEPPWATPAVSWMAGFFPSKGKLSSR